MTQILTGSRAMLMFGPKPVRPIGAGCALRCRVQPKLLLSQQKVNVIIIRNIRTQGR